MRPKNMGSAGVVLMLCLSQSPQEAQKLIEALSKDDVQVREEAMRGLKKLGPRARPALEKAVRSKNPETAMRARDVLDMLDIMERVPAVILEALPGLEDRLFRGTGRLWVEILLLAHYGGPKRPGVPELTMKQWEFLVERSVERASTPSQKQEVAWIIAKRNVRKAIPSVLRFLEADDLGLRGNAINALAHMKARKAEPELLKILGDEKDPNRMDAARALGILKSEKALPGLLALLKHRDAWARKGAAEALGHLGSKKAAGDLRHAAANDKDFGVRRSALLALDRIGADE